MVDGETDSWNGSADTLPTLFFSQFVPGREDSEAHRQEGKLDQSNVGLMCRRVVPPTTFDGRMPEDLLNAKQFDVEDGCNGEILSLLNC